MAQDELEVCDHGADVACQLCGYQEWYEEEPASAVEGVGKAQETENPADSDE